MKNCLANFNVRIKRQPPVKTLQIFLRCKCCILAICVVGAALYLSFPLIYTEKTFSAIGIPTFMIGYILINVVGIITQFSHYVDVLADFFFCSVGTVGFFVITVELFYTWIWWLRQYYDSNSKYWAVEYLMQALMNLVIVLLQVVQIVFLIRGTRVPPRYIENIP